MRPFLRRPSVQQPARETYVTIHEHRGRRRLDVPRKLSAEELAAERRLGLIWREEWRAEKAHQSASANGSAVGASKHSPAAGKSASSRRFAEGIARAELGRFYWNAKLERALDAARRRPKRGDKAHK
jgi:hypothetical protein